MLVHTARPYHIIRNLIIYKQFKNKKAEISGDAPFQLPTAKLYTTKTKSSKSLILECRSRTLGLWLDMHHLAENY